MSRGKLIGDVNENVKYLKEMLEIHAETSNMNNVAVQGKFSSLQTKKRK
jgi:hypothetical protein